MDTSNYPAQVAENVGAAMLAAGVSQKGLAESTGIPRVTLIRRLRGLNPFTVAELDRIATVLGIEVRDLTNVGDAA